jgi:hypothetical protein
MIQTREVRCTREPKIWTILATTTEEISATIDEKKKQIELLAEKLAKRNVLGGAASIWVVSFYELHSNFNLPISLPSGHMSIELEMLGGTCLSTLFYKYYITYSVILAYDVSGVKVSLSLW